MTRPTEKWKYLYGRWTTARPMGGAGGRRARACSLLSCYLAACTNVLAMSSCSLLHMSGSIRCIGISAACSQRKKREGDSSICSRRACCTKRNAVRTTWLG